MDRHLLLQGLEVTLLGLAGVFAVLIIFYAVTRLMLIIARKGKNKNAPENS
ncbi:MAG: OadG family protein [Clostridiales Family XIII bacterium]|jgi:Na+-transporting methylmalonyl-CoA/oxaloacetate decarboxylase gamma subunit|nr:OadG family protein [Clostridiales Family XIII bacterium]